MDHYFNFERLAISDKSNSKYLLKLKRLLILIIIPIALCLLCAANSFADWTILFAPIEHAEQLDVLKDITEITHDGYLRNKKGFVRDSHGNLYRIEEEGPGEQRIVVKTLKPTDVGDVFFYLATANPLGLLKKSLIDFMRFAGNGIAYMTQGCPTYCGPSCPDAYMIVQTGMGG